MANVFEDPTIFAKEVLRRVENKLFLAKRVNRSYEKEYKNVGETVYVRRPVYLKSVDGPDVTGQLQDIVQTSLPVTINYWKSVPVQIGVRDWNLSDVKFSENVIDPAAVTLAQDIETALANLSLGVANAVGTAGTHPSTLRHVGLVKKRMDKLSVPVSDRHMALNSDAELELHDSLKGLLQPEMVGDLVKHGSLGMAQNMELFTSQSLPSHTKGTASGTPLINGADQGATETDQGDATLVTDGWTASQTPILKKGDVFTIGDDVYAVNPRTKQSTGELRQFTVTADTNSDSGGNATIPIEPALNANPDSPYQNVSASPDDGDAINMVDSHSINLGFHRDAFTLVMVDIELPEAFKTKRRVSHDGISITLSSDADILTFSQITRLDVMFGVKVINSELACRLMGESY